MSGVLALIAGSGQDRNISLADAEVPAGGSGVQTASFRLNTDRSAYQGIDGAFSALYAWCAANGTPANYEVRASLVSGSTPGGDSVGSWLALSSSRTWSATDALADASPNVIALTIEIRRATGTLTLDSCTVTLSADRSA